MPKTNSLALPYYFRNIGSQVASADNLKAASPLVPKSIVCPLGAVVKVNLQACHQVQTSCTTEWKSVPPEVKQVLAGKDSSLVLWEVVIHNRSIQFHFRDITQQTRSKHAIDGSIVIEDYGFLTLELEAQPFKKLEPARKLSCLFSSNAIWGDFVDLTEWRDGFGIRKLIVYPNATAEHFEKISNH